jgi:hypothetical protein
LDCFLVVTITFIKELPIASAKLFVTL